MTKRIFIILTMMVLCITTLSAQSIIGKWYADEVAEAMELNELGDVVLNIKERTISTDFYINIEDDGAKIKMLYSIPGTYTKSGKKVTAKFNADKTDVKVVDFKTNDPELLAEMKTEKGKKELYEVISSLIESEMGDLVKGLAEISAIFNKFTVKSVTAKTLCLDIFIDNDDSATTCLKRHGADSNKVVKNKQLKLFKNYK